MNAPSTDSMSAPTSPLVSTPFVAAHPLHTQRRRLRAAAVGAVLVIAPLVPWSLWPLKVESIKEGEGLEHATPTFTTADNSATAIASLPALDLEAFNAPLWTVAQPPPPPPPAAAPPPLKLQLLGIDTTQKQGVPSYRAVLYDPDQDKVLMLRSGDSIGPRVITSVDQHSVTLAVTIAGGGRTSGTEQVLSLHPEDGQAGTTSGRPRP